MFYINVCVFVHPLYVLIDLFCGSFVVAALERLAGRLDQLSD